MTYQPVSLEATQVSVTYNNGFKAIHDVSFRLQGGTICALVGVNGGGKSTLFKSIMGLVKTSQGEILLSRQPIRHALKQNQVAYVPQSEDIDWNFPILVRDVVMQGRYGFMNFLRRPSTVDKDKVRQAMQRMGIEDLAGRQIGELSGGQKKRVFLARALAQESQTILLDEPFTGVDFTTEEAIMNLLRELREEGHLILVSTHNLGNIPDYCNEVVFINRTIVAAGNIQDTFTQQNLVATFGGVLKHVGILGETLHQDDDERSVTIISDHEKPAVFYGKDHQNATLIRDRQSPEQPHHTPR
ncbi:metal ABC transporter ATP-binding protein [Vibrio mangrovi]|uniref:ATP-binding cassette domain-containing protein n=1 Tax=Vibrio mangrovi TaxID=474394 RepID=A0A1Y6IWP1_9VIBR|nr:ATP-binding cassette domain-containing protein [Vibrio mangrovi]MDW6005479.1 ATP-binding cassette domain-containing protein [Vibrio mangrovi]SMS02079.1 Energy-coupling factor transporter ATP-binding protein EcfA3 [Vibrio mangrovi]